MAGRTDAGVHATGQVAHADLAADLDPTWLVRRLARLLPPDVRVRAVTPVPAAFDARFAALRRHYRYRIATAAHGAEPLRARDTLSWPHPLDLAAVAAASELLLGEHDFAAFCKRREGATTVRELQRFALEPGRRRGRDRRAVRRRVLPLDGAQPDRGAAGGRAGPAGDRLAAGAAAPGGAGQRGVGGPGARAHAGRASTTRRTPSWPPAPTTTRRVRTRG